jgi:hypothetical protein
MYIMEFYSIIEKNEIMSFARKYMKVEIIMLSEITHFTKTSSIYFLSFVLS